MLLAGKLYRRHGGISKEAARREGDMALVVKDLLLSIYINNLYTCTGYPYSSRCLQIKSENKSMAGEEKKDRSAERDFVIFGPADVQGERTP